MSKCYQKALTNIKLQPIQSHEVHIIGTYNKKMTIIGKSYLRIIDNIVNDIKYDIYVDDILLYHGINYKKITDYLNVNTGNKHFIIKHKKNIIYDADLLLLADGIYTLILIGDTNNVRVMLLDDNITCPKNGNIRIRLIHAAFNVPSIDIKIDNMLYNNVEYKSSNTYEINKQYNTLSSTVNVSLIHKKHKFNTYPLYLISGGVYTAILSGTIDNLFILTKEDTNGNCFYTRK